MTSKKIRPSQLNFFGLFLLSLYPTLPATCSLVYISNSPLCMLAPNAFVKLETDSLRRSSAIENSGQPERKRRARLFSLAPS